MARLKLIAGFVGLLASIACLQAGAASAATVFCDENVESCPKESIYPIGTSYTADSNGLYTRISTAFPFHVIDCETATMKWKTTETTGTGVLKGSVESVLIGSCVEKEKKCAAPTVEARNLPWNIEFERKSGINYLTVASALRVTCSWGGPCTYGVGTYSGRLPVIEGATRVWVENVLGKTEGSFLCPQEITWQADLLLESPEPAFLALG